MLAYITKRVITKTECPSLEKDIPSGTPVYSESGNWISLHKLLQPVSLDMRPPYHDVPKDALIFDLHNSD